MEAQEGKVDVDSSLTVERFEKCIKHFKKLGASKNTEIRDANYNKIILVEYDISNHTILLITE
jgi:predicted lactoylglutathione lyase